MAICKTIEEVADDIQKKLDSNTDKKKIILTYAFNGVGKTRLSTIIHDNLQQPDDSEEIKVLSYNAFFEDLFTWNNDEYTLHFTAGNQIVTYIIDQGLENQITDNFQKLTQSKVVPVYNLADGRITFSFSPGDERKQENIKISRGEESLFIWCIFYTVLESSVLALNEKEEDRDTELFNNLDYIIIDDPVSSIDDTKIITMALGLIKVIDSLKNCNIKFLITTHHALFYNVLCNEYITKKGFSTVSLLLSKKTNEFEIDNRQGDTPFAYHIAIKNEITKAIDDNDLKKYHFNLFRGLLEKTANFLGYKKWSECINTNDEKELARLVNLYSHGKLSDLESNAFPDEHKELFKKVFAEFVVEFKWKS